ncbi:MAG: hypothetical protein R6X33_08480 [Candidatus Brocadiia bacterium]
MKPGTYLTAAFFLIAIVAVLRTGFPVSGQQAPKLETDVLMVPLKMVPTSRRMLPLRQNRMPSAQGAREAPKQIEVRLQRTTYQYTKVLVRGDRASTVSGQAVCFELVSDAPYTWAHFVAPNIHPGAFALLSVRGGKTYLGWSDGWRVTLADVSSPRDRIVAFHEYSVPDIPNRPAGPAPVDIRALVPGGGNWGGPQYQLDTYVEIISLVRGVNGELVLTVKDAYSPAAARLILRDGEWELLEHFPDGLPENRQPAG